MKSSLSVFTAAFCASLPAVQAGKTDCLDEDKRYTLESVCRTECEKVDAVAFSASYDETNDACRCYANIDGLGTYTGSDDTDSQLTCYSMAGGEKTKILGYGDCTIDFNYGTEYNMPECEGDCFEDREVICRDECSTHNSAAFAVGYRKDDNTCRCYPGKGVFTGTGDRESPLTCYSMADNKIKFLDYGDCRIEKFDGAVFSEHTMNRCQEPQIGKLLRGSVSV